MAAYEPEPIENIVPTHPQQMVIDAALEAIQQVAPAFWATGRGAGKSTVKALIAHRLLDEEGYSPYKVVPNA